eukprot:353529-Chlamydomonas_euryale.AAC.16
MHLCMQRTMTGIPGTHFCRLSFSFSTSSHGDSRGRCGALLAITSIAAAAAAPRAPGVTCGTDAPPAGARQRCPYVLLPSSSAAPPTPSMAATPCPSPPRQPPAGAQPGKLLRCASSMAAYASPSSNNRRLAGRQAARGLWRRQASVACGAGKHTWLVAQASKRGLQCRQAHVACGAGKEGSSRGPNGLIALAW